MIRAALLLAGLLVLGGCSQLAGGGLAIAENRIGRQATYNDARLTGCLSLADEVRRATIDAIEDGDMVLARELLAEYRALMDSCRPALLIEEGRRAVSDG